ncbi:MAG: nucleotidyl transferase AbiEii/AbiGii toxin family protein [Deltaproteobacteria bacterium]|nr:nucleotidyl transferase AbiEii/AbiGii toxin family protein [Deltaproteobacteria bacterium]
MKYATATAFRTALEERLKNRSREKGIELQRLRRQVAFDRFLIRLFQFFPKDLLLKGGYAMELRLEKARATKDIDLVLKASRVGTGDKDKAVRQLLQDAVQKNSGDFFEFLVGEPTLDLEAVPYGGSRYPIEALLDRRLFVRFPIDVVVSALFLEPIERIESEDWLGFAGIEKMPFPAISKEQQFAEKLHAYTLPRGESENSRAKDLIDITLLMASGELKTDFLKTAIGKVFEYRATHKIPKMINPPPPSWEPKFSKMAKECGLEWNLAKAFGEVDAFIEKIVNG